MDDTATAMTMVHLGRLLIVDDEIDLMTALREALSERGYEVAAFSDPRDALAAMREGKFDALLTDLMMPGMGGIELIGEAIKIDPNIVSIIMTGQGTVQTAVEAMQSGAFDYMLKPFKLAAIMPVLSRAIEVRRLRTEVMQLRETVAINDLCKAITHTLDFDTLLHKVADAAIQQCEADEVSIVLPTRDKELYVAVVRGRHEKAILGQRMPIGEGVAGWVSQHHEPLILHGPVNDSRFRPREPRADIVSSICMPMAVGGKFVGVLNVNATRRTRPFTLGEVKALTIIASIASPVLESGWLFKQMREAEAKYRSIVENAVEGIFQTTPDGQYLEANPALARMDGYESPEELMATVTDIERQFYVAPHRRAEFVRLMEERGRVAGFESNVYRKDGSSIWISENTRAVCDATGKLLYYEGTTEDITARKQTEADLLRAEEQYRGIFDNAVIGIFRTTSDGRILAANPRLAQMCGFDSPVELMADVTDLAKQLYVDPQRREEFKSLIDEHGCVTNFEHALYRRDGSIMWAVANARVVHDDDGNILYYDGTLEDITSRKRAEEALRLSEERLRLALSSARVGTWSWSIPENAVIWDEYLHPLFGLKPGTFPGRFEDFANMVHPGDRERVAREVMNCANAGMAYDSEFRIVWPDNSVHHIASRAKVYGDEPECSLRMTGICWDVSERKRAEQRQAAQHAVTSVLSEVCSLVEVSPKILQAICETTGWEVGAVWEADREANELRCIGLWRLPSVEIPQFERMCREHTFASGIGLPGRVWVSGKPAWIPDIIVDSNLPRAPVAKKEGLHCAFAFPIMLGSEVLGVIEFFSSHIQQPDDDLLQIFTAIGSQVGQFIERRQAEENLHASNLQLHTALEQLQAAQSKILEQERLRALGTMASGVAHDFNNALSPILGFSELLLNHPKGKLQDQERVMRYLTMINTAARDAASIVGRLREFYRARERTEVFLPVNLNQIVDQAISLTQPKWKDQAQAAGVNVIVECDMGKIPLVAGNESELREVLTNFIFNAVDAMPQGGTIKLATRMGDGANASAGKTDAGCDCVSPTHPLTHSPTQVVLSVSDTGAGMTEEVRKQCLEPFFTTKGDRGTGLGLSMVHGIIRRHDGTVDIVSEVGKGTTFTITLPEYKSVKAAIAEIRPQTVPTRSLRVLVVDDESMLREMVGAYLSGDGHEVEVATSGLEALQKLHAGRFDLVITDRAMPEMGGDELARTIKQTAPGKPVIMLTGFGEFMQAVGEKPEGVDEVVSKPPTLQAVREAIAKVITTSR